MKRGNLDILRLGLGPGVLQSRASSSIIVGIVARAANGDSGNQTTTNGLVQRSPSGRSWPAVITRHAAARRAAAFTRWRGNGRGGQSRNGYQPGLHSGVEEWWKVKDWSWLADQKWEEYLPIASLNPRQGGKRSRCSRFYGMLDGHQAPRPGLEEGLTTDRRFSPERLAWTK